MRTSKLLRALLVLLLCLEFGWADRITPIKNPPSVDEVVRRRLSWEEKCLISTKRSIDPRTKVSDECVVYYLHNHKTGGSTMCKTAMENGFKITGLLDNCNVPPHIRNDESVNIQDFIFQQKFDFIAQENKPFRLNESNTRFVFMTTFRNPMDRVVSHLHHEFCGHGKTLDRDRLETYLCSKFPETLSDLIHDPCFMRAHMRSITTDYYVSMLTGCVNRMSDNQINFTQARPRTCGEVHLEEAKRILNYFSVILISDSSTDFDRYGQLLDLKFSLTFKQQYRTGTHIQSKDVVANLLHHNSSSKRVLEMATSLDMKLYEYAKQLAASILDREEAGIRALKTYRMIHPSRKLRELLYHRDLSEAMSKPGYVEGPLC